MRVAMVILDHLPLEGGAQRQLAAVAPLLERRGVEVHVLTRRAPGLARRAEVAGIPVHRLPAPGTKATASLGFTAAALTRLAALRPDVVHAYSLFSPATIAALAKQLLGAATVVKVLRGGRAGDVERLRAKAFSRARIRWIRATTDRFVAISGEIDAELEALGIPRERRRSIPNGVDTDRFQPATPALRRQRRRELALPDAPTVVYCGRLVAEKQVDLLLDAWKGIQQSQPGASLVIVGAGPESAKLARLAGRGVQLAGEQVDVLPYLQAADVFALPSATEGLSNALLEAMAVGLPVVATRVGGTTDVVVDGVSGRLVAPGDRDALREVLGSVLSDPARAGLGARARECVVDAYALPSVADRLVALYQELAAGAASSPADRKVRAGRGLRA